jgi:hypothetical protein
MNVPVNVEGNKRLASHPPSEIEAAVVRVVKEYA